MLASPGSTTSAHTRVPSGRSNRRPHIVCVPCHQKKIKCDLQNNPAAPCTKCVDAGGECRIRSSKRVKNANAQNSGFASSSRRAAGVQSNVVGYSDQDGSGLEQSADLAPGTLGRTGPQVATAVAGRGDEMSLLSYAADVFAGSDYQPSLPQPPQRPLPDPDADAALRSQAVPPTASPAGLHNASTTATTTAPSYVGDSGFLQIFHGIGAAVMAERQQSYGDENNLRGLLAAGLRDGRDEVPPAALQESYLETFYQFQHTWCPILDRVDGQLPAAARESVLLQNTLALVGSHVDPPVLPHARAAEYYERSKVLFYSNHEKNALLAISALMLFYCWGPGPPDVMSIDTVWWWTGVAIRQAQQLGLHREPRPGQPPLPGETPGLRRRIWWTLFARERLTSICMGRPCMINVDDCDVAALTLADFPQPATDRAEIFIQWVRLCAIIGRASTYLARRTPDTPFPVDLAAELQQWVTSLPDHLQLPLQGTTRAAPRFDRDVYQLHLPYLTTVTLLHLRGASPAPPTPTSASCASPSAPWPSCGTRPTCLPAASSASTASRPAMQPPRAAAPCPSPAAPAPRTSTWACLQTRCPCPCPSWRSTRASSARATTGATSSRTSRPTPARWWPCCWTPSWCRPSRTPDGPPTWPFSCRAFWTRSMTSLRPCFDTGGRWVACHSPLLCGHPLSGYLSHVSL